MDNEFDREQKIIVIVIERCVAAPPIKSVCVSATFYRVGRMNLSELTKTHFYLSVWLLSSQFKANADIARGHAVSQN